MAIVEVKVPQLSESVAEATLLQWKKKVGDAVAIDDCLEWQTALAFACCGDDGFSEIHVNSQTA